MEIKDAPIVIKKGPKVFSISIDHRHFHEMREDKRLLKPLFFYFQIAKKTGVYGGLKKGYVCLSGLETFLIGYEVCYQLLNNFDVSARGEMGLLDFAKVKEQMKQVESFSMESKMARDDVREQISQFCKVKK